MRWIPAVCLAVAACTAHAPRSTGMGQSSPVEISSLGLSQVEGTVKELRVDEGVIVVETEGREIPLRLEKDTAVFVRGGTAGIAEIEEGVPVRASFAQDGGKNVARWIEVPREETPPEEAAPPAEQQPESPFGPSSS
jgi:hypothetical protein